MIVFTRLGDTPSSIAARMAGDPDMSLADKIWQENLDTLACKVSTYSGIYAPNRAIWVPGFSKLDEQPALRKHLKRKLEFLPLHGRINLAKLQARQVDINHMMSSAKVIQLHNERHKKDSQAIGAAMGVKVASESTTRAVERVTEPAEHFTHHMEHLNNKTLALVRAQEAKDHEAIKAARAELKVTYKAAMQGLDRDAKFYTSRLSMRTKKELRSVNRIARNARREGIMVADLMDVRRIAKIAHYGKFAQRGCFAFSLAVGGLEVYETYKEGGDWEQKAVGIGVEMGSVAALGIGLSLVFNPIGWVALIGLSVAEGVGLSFLGSVVENGTEKFYGWAKKSIAGWF